MTDIEKTIEEAKADMLPFESWKRLSGEGSAAFAAFCVFRDMEADKRSIRGAVETVEPDAKKQNGKYNVWRNYAAKFRWQERVADYDRYTDNLKQGELRKTIEAQGEMHRAVTGKMLEVVKKKLDTMNPDELTQGNVTEWANMAIKAEREAGQFSEANCLGVSTSRNSTLKQGELNFTPEFNGL